ncbi:MAG: hypothetical protein ILO10_08525 [Kiritimatiellae bacterium]|nr:hypothetical protein [Kiritimatiellia bacterium]
MSEGRTVKGAGKVARVLKWAVLAGLVLAEASFARMESGQGDSRVHPTVRRRASFARMESGQGDWKSPGPNGVVPFEVEYRRVPMMFFAEFDRRVAFASGKRVVIDGDSGGYADLSVYALQDGTYVLTDDGVTLSRVDAADETVDMGLNGRWYRFPDGAAEIGPSWSGHVTIVLESGEEKIIEESVPYGDSLDGWRLLGKFVPYGKFVAGEGLDKSGQMN